MALQVNLPDSSVGLPAPEAYARISHLQFNVKHGVVIVTVETHANVDARLSDKTPILTKSYSGIVGIDLPNLDDTLPGIRTVLYEWLKTLPDFTQAIDVL